MKKLFFALFCCVLILFIFVFYIASPLSEWTEKGSNSTNTAIVASIFLIAIYPLARFIAIVINRFTNSLFGDRQNYQYN